MNIFRRLFGVCWWENCYNAKRDWYWWNTECGSFLGSEPGAFCCHCGRRVKIKKESERW